jgi:hypothetical protein
MGLLETATRLLEDDDAVVTERDVERGLAFLDSLAARTTSKEIRRDLQTVRKQLEGSSNKSVGKALDQLLGARAGGKKAARPRRRR